MSNICNFSRNIEIFASEMTRRPMDDHGCMVTTIFCTNLLFLITAIALTIIAALTVSGVSELMSLTGAKVSLGIGPYLLIAGLFGTWMCCVISRRGRLSSDALDIVQDFRTEPYSTPIGLTEPTFSGLSEDLIRAIFLKSSLRGVIVGQAVCKKFWDALQNNLIWRPLQTNYFPKLVLPSHAREEDAKHAILIRSGAVFAQIIRTCKSIDTSRNFNKYKGTHIQSLQIQNGYLLKFYRDAQNQVKIIRQDRVDAQLHNTVFHHTEGYLNFKVLNEKWILLGPTENRKYKLIKKEGQKIVSRDPKFLERASICAPFSAGMLQVFKDKFTIFKFGNFSQSHPLSFPIPTENFTHLVCSQEYGILITDSTDVWKIDLKLNSVNCLGKIGWGETIEAVVMWEHTLLAGTGHGLGSVYSLDIRTGKEQVLINRPLSITALHVHHDMLFIGAGNEIIIWDLPGHRTLMTFKAPYETDVTSMAILENSLWVVQKDRLSYIDFTPKSLQDRSD